VRQNGPQRQSEILCFEEVDFFTGEIRKPKMTHKKSNKFQWLLVLDFSKKILTLLLEQGNSS
jgi:hypothetical protein